jgi:hypothetical protein
VIPKAQSQNQAAFWSENKWRLRERQTFEKTRTDDRGSGRQTQCRQILTSKNSAIIQIPVKKTTYLCRTKRGQCLDPCFSTYRAARSCHSPEIAAPGNSIRMFTYGTLQIIQKCCFEAEIDLWEAKLAAVLCFFKRRMVLTMILCSRDDSLTCNK